MGSTEFSWNWRDAQLGLELCMHNRGDSYNGYPNSDGYFGSFCLDGLAVALNAFAHSSSFPDCITKCINYRGDADSTGSIAGQLAGAFYVFDGIPAFLINPTLQWDDSENLIRSLMLTSWYREASAAERRAFFLESIDKTIAASTDNDVEACKVNDCRPFDSSTEAPHYTTAFPVYPLKEELQSVKSVSIFGRMIRFFSSSSKK
jgi:hypothetical protein